jgi:hypothetical protein
MNDQQFGALLAALKELTGAIQDGADLIQSELMLVRDEISGVRDVFAIAHGVESNKEWDDRVSEGISDGSIFADLDTPVGE